MGLAFVVPNLKVLKGLIGGAIGGAIGAIGFLIARGGRWLRRADHDIKVADVPPVSWCDIDGPPGRHVFARY